MMYTLLYAARTFKSLLFISSGIETAGKKKDIVSHSHNGMKYRAGNRNVPVKLLLHASDLSQSRKFSWLKCLWKGFSDDSPWRKMTA